MAPVRFEWIGLKWNTIFGFNPKKWLKKLNRRGYAGYHDWRLPTAGGSSITAGIWSKKNGDFYIDPVFSNKQPMIFTGDMENGSENPWFVHFYLGLVFQDNADMFYHNKVRPVRSMK